MELIFTYELLVTSAHIPILLFLCVLSFQLGTSLKRDSFRWMAWGWILNLVHLFVKGYGLISLIGTNLESNAYSPSVLSTSLGNAFDITASFLFFVAGIKLINENRGIENRNILFPKAGYIALALFLILYGITYTSIGFNLFNFNIPGKYYGAFYAPVAIFSTYALYTVFRGFKENTQSIKWSRALKAGFLCYFIIQPVSIYTGAKIPDSAFIPIVSAIGYTLGGLFKSAILYGMHRVFVHVTEQKLDTEKTNEHLNNILGRTFHEIIAPLKTIRNKINEFDVPKKRESFKLTSASKKQLNLIENNYNRVIAVISAAMKVYEESLGGNEDYDLYDHINTQELGPNNINALVEVAIISLKDFIEDEEALNLHREYSKGCNIICHPEEIVQIVYNLLKNSFDSFEGEIGKIFINSSTYKKEINGEIKKFVILKIADDGPGIPKSIQDFIFDERFSTKDKNSRGYGLFVSKELTKKNNGVITIKSPYNFNEFRADINSGSLFTLTFETF